MFSLIIAAVVSTKVNKMMPSITLMFALIYLFSTSPFGGGRGGVGHGSGGGTFFADACSSRTVPKPRPSTTSSSSSSIVASSKLPITSSSTTTTSTTTTTTTTTPRPNITFPTYKCPATYDAWYCLNDATCFSVKIGDSIMYNCECASGFMGPRCEYKELDGSYLPKRPSPMLEKASIASGATLALLFMLFVCLTLYLRYDQKSSNGKYMDASSASSTADDDADDVDMDSASCCRYCNEKCCNDENVQTFAYQAAAAENWRRYGGGGGLGGVGVNGYTKQHLEAIPMNFAIKRTTKM